MKRTTIMLPDDDETRLRHEARRRGVSVAEIVREAVAQHLRPEHGAGAPAFFALGKAGSADGSEHVDDHVRSAMRRRRRG